MSSLASSFTKGATSAMRSAAYGVGASAVSAARDIIRNAGLRYIRRYIRPRLNMARGAVASGLGGTSMEMGGLSRGSIDTPYPFSSSFQRVAHRARRATARLRSRIRGRLNRARRRARRAIRRRRAVRRHKRNPYTRHRQLNKRYLRSKIVRFRRRSYGFRKIPWRRINTWFSFGRWVLFGNYLSSATSNLGLNQVYSSSSLRVENSGSPGR